MTDSVLTQKLEESLQEFDTLRRGALNRKLQGYLRLAKCDAINNDTSDELADHLKWMLEGWDETPMFAIRYQLERALQYSREADEQARAQAAVDQVMAPSTREVDTTVVMMSSDSVHTVNTITVAVPDDVIRKVKLHQRVKIIVPGL